MSDYAGSRVNVSSRTNPDVYKTGLALAREAFNLQPGDSAAFSDLERRVVAFQRQNNPFYERFCQAAATGHAWLPVEAFGMTDVAAFDTSEAEALFVSSGTGSSMRSRHFVRSLAVYRESVVRTFTDVVGGGPFTLLAHLPGYAGLQREEQRSVPVGSSLVEMAHTLIRAVGDPVSGFFLDDAQILLRALSVDPSKRSPVVLLGAAFGLLDLVESGVETLFGPADLIIETGGMKTHRRETTRQELHSRLARGLGVAREQVMSEYGMCELFSQFYDTGEGHFSGPPWARVAIVDPEDPTTVLPAGAEGRLVVVDLANVFTVSRLLTSDRGVQSGEGFKVLGRVSGAALRGCNFLVEHAQAAVGGHS